MKKIRCKIEMDMKSGEYEIWCENVSHPGKGIDYNDVKFMMEKVFKDWGKKIEGGIESTDKVVKFIH